MTMSWHFSHHSELNVPTNATLAMIGPSSPPIKGMLVRVHGSVNMYTKKMHANSK